MKKNLILLLFVCIFMKCQKECTIGFDGRKCQCELIPKVLIIEEIVLQKFPIVNAKGEPFDPLNGKPDLCIVLKLGDTEVYSSIAPVLQLKEDARQDIEYTFKLDAPIRLETPESVHELLLFDFDSYLKDGVDFMGGVSFSPYQSGLDFPDELEITCDNCEVQFKLNVKYVF